MCLFVASACADTPVKHEMKSTEKFKCLSEKNVMRNLPPKVETVSSSFVNIEGLSKDFSASLFLA